MSEVIKELGLYLDERIEQTGTMLRRNFIADNAAYRLYATRYLELEDIRNKLNELSENVDSKTEPKAPTDDWIPCSERLPDKMGRYLITYNECGWSRNSQELCIGFSYFGPGNSDAESLWRIERQMVDCNIEVLAWKEVTPYEKPVL